MKCEVGDVLCWTYAWGGLIDPPMWSLVTEIRGDVLPVAHGVIVDRGGLDDNIAIGGQVSTIMSGITDIHCVPEAEIPDEMWAKIAVAQMLGGEKPKEKTDATT